MRKRDHLLSGWNPLLILACVILTLILSGFLIWNYQEETLESERLKAAAGRTQAFHIEYEILQDGMFGSGV